VPGLIALGRKYADRGLRLLFFPCNQFCAEEPGTAAEIAAFYVGQHGLPASSLMERGDVNGSETQAVYKFLRAAPLDENTDVAGGEIEWNFTKFIVGRDGQVLRRYGQEVKPDFLDERLPALLA
jgi:glutathione peroxidase